MSSAIFSLDTTVGQRGYIETEHSFASFAFVNGRLQIVGHSLDVTLVVPADVRGLLGDLAA